MEIINRAEAQAAGIGKYYTGEPCLRGHVAPRYTQSGTCCQCLRGSVPLASADFPPDALAAIAAHRSERAMRDHALSMLAEIKVWAHVADIAAIRDAAVACCIGIYPHLTPDDVAVRVGATAADGIFGQYRLKVPAEYIMTVRQLSAMYSNKRAAGDMHNGPAPQPVEAPRVQRLLEVLEK